MINLSPVQKENVKRKWLDLRGGIECPGMVNIKIYVQIEMPVKNQLQGMLAVFEPLDRAQSKKNFEPSFVKIG
jgi:hypothetical protein